jgi:hypothetical protein
MKQNSSTDAILTVLLVLALFVLGWVLIPEAWLEMIQGLLYSNPQFANPIPTTVIPTLSYPQLKGPVPPGRELISGNTGITVTRILYPADSYMGKAAFPAVTLEAKTYLVVDVSVRCAASGGKCHVIESDFAVETQDGQDTQAELSGDYSDELSGVFAGGDIQPGKSLSGSLFFIVPRGESGMLLIYPYPWGLGDTLRFALGK